jgi:hypothetical protein
MNIYKKILILVLIFGSLSILLYFVLKPLHVTCKTTSDCPFGQKCDNNECKPISNCETKEDCNNHGTCSSGNCVCDQGWSGDNCKTQKSNCKTKEDCNNHGTCSSGNCVCDQGWSGDNCKTQNSPSTPSINNQPASSIQIVNNTSEDYLHVMFECNSLDQKFTKVDGKGSISPPIDWRQKAWDPLGAQILAEIIIPKDEYVIFTIGDDFGGFIFAPLKMKDPKNSKPLTQSTPRSGSTLDGVLTQTPVLFEGGKDRVADISGVNGINFRTNYTLTGRKGIQNMKINKNPCLRIDKKFQLETGCWSPVKQICGGSPTCDCKADQNCKFNKCSETLFDIPDNMKIYENKYDGGNPYDVVKKFINQNSNLKDNTDQQRYCDDIQYQNGDFTVYCYDYNDLNSSPWLAAPYKVKVIYNDL